MEILLNDLLEKQILNKQYFQDLYVDNTFNLSIKYESKFENAKHLRDIIQYVFEIIEVEKLWINRFILIWDELNNNAIEYWSLTWEENILNINISTFNDEVFIDLSVVDNWTWEKHKTSLEMNELREQKLSKWFENHDSIRGRWLFLIISKLVDELNFIDDENGWLKVQVIKKITK